MSKFDLLLHNKNKSHHPLHNTAIRAYRSVIREIADKAIAEKGETENSVALAA